MSDETVVDYPGRGFLEPASPEAEPLECPIAALGQNDGRYFFFSPSGERRELTARELRSDAGQISLFDGDTKYLCAAWPRRDRDGQVIRGDFNGKAAHAGLVAMCAEKGMYDPETAIRGRGVWRAPDGGLICHSGDRLLLSDGERAPGLRLAGALYPRRPAILPPAPEPAPASVARDWKRDFAWWRFKPLGLGGAASDRGPDGLAAELLFNATCLAMLGAGPRWRVHMLVKASAGSGKSALLRFIDAAHGDLALSISNFSEAGVRNSLANEARPLLLDEAEGDERGLMSSVIELIRQMSDGAKGARGDGGSGGSRHFAVASSAFLFCINMPVLLPQDMSRFVILDMLKAIPAHERAAFDAIERAAANSAALRARAFHGWPRFKANLPLLRAALCDDGCSTRQADVLGGLLAAGAMMTDDRAIDAGAARDLAEAVRPLVETLQAEEEDNSEARRCWLALLTRRCDVWRGGEGQTIASLLMTALSDGYEAVATRRALSDYCGMRLVREAGGATMPEAPCLYVANGKNDFLRATFRDTPWRDGGWAHQLVNLPGASASKGSVRLGGIKQRAVAIPLAQLPRRGEVGDDEAGDG